MSAEPVARETAAAGGDPSPWGAAPRLPGEIRVERLASGLTVCLLENRQAPLVTTALCYRAGTRDEPPGHGGVAHFLEHMMFKGSARYGPGEIDRRTQRLGGANNAFTTHDATTYYFQFAADRWTAALAIEADRMAALTLDPREVASERQVILEEIALYDDEPWDYLEKEVMARLHRGHPYGRPVLGTREELLATDAAVLAAFHQRCYRPANAVLVVAGDPGEGALERAAAAFGGLDGGPVPRPAAPPAEPPSGVARVEVRRGEVPRLLVALPGPAGDHPDHPAVKLLLAVLTGGRASRLHRALIDEGQLAIDLAADISETLDPGTVSLAVEVLPGVEPARVEAELLAQLAALTETPPSPEEIERGKRVALADWIFHHEQVHQQALTASFALAHFDLGYPERYLGRLLACGPDQLLAAARRHLLVAQGGVVGWSLPADGRE